MADEPPSDPATDWICNTEWLAPRVDAPMSVLVRHVCDLPGGHGGGCHCSCGADRPAGTFDPMAIVVETDYDRFNGTISGDSPDG